MNIKKVLFSVGVAGVASLSVANPVFAGTSCQPIYGGGQTCITTGNLIVNKQVVNPQTNQLVENLEANDPKYQPDNLVTFKITLSNSGGTALQNIQVKDVLPQFVTFATGNGVYDTNSKTLSFAIANLNPNESQSYTVQAKVVPAGSLPSDKNVVCQVNQAIATVNGEVHQDNADFCIEKPVAGQQPQPEQPQQPVITKGGKVVFPAPSVKTTPPTGPEALPMLALLPTGILGYIVRKKAILK